MKVSWRRQPGARDAVMVAVSKQGWTDRKQQACRYTAYALGTGTKEKTNREHKWGIWMKVQEAQSLDKETCAFQTHLQQQEPWQSEPQVRSKWQRQKKELRKKTLGKHMGQHCGEKRQPRRQMEGTKMEGCKKKKKKGDERVANNMATVVKEG